MRTVTSGRSSASGSAAPSKRTRSAAARRSSTSAFAQRARATISSGSSGRGGVGTPRAARTLSASVTPSTSRSATGVSTISTSANGASPATRSQASATRLVTASAPRSPIVASRARQTASSGRVACRYALSAPTQRSGCSHVGASQSLRVARVSSVTGAGGGGPATGVAGPRSAAVAEPRRSLVRTNASAGAARSSSHASRKLSPNVAFWRSCVQSPAWARRSRLTRAASSSSRSASTAIVHSSPLAIGTAVGSNPSTAAAQRATSSAAGSPCSSCSLSHPGTGWPAAANLRRTRSSSGCAAVVGQATSTRRAATRASSVTKAGRSAVGRCSSTSRQSTVSNAASANGSGPGGA
jgi:hypothetical protein